MKIATSVYPLEWHADYDSYVAKVTSWVRVAADAGADLLVFPEYAGVEVALIGPPDPRHADRNWVQAASPASSGTLKLWQDLATVHDVHILAGSGPCRTEAGFVNRARIFAPNGPHGHQDKTMLTPWERSETELTPGNGQRVFETSLGRIGVLICYDAEFPQLARSLAADVLLIPACTDSRAGAERLRVAARARALENQCIAVLSSTTRPVPTCALVDENCGFAGVYTPPDNGFPDTGILTESAFDLEGWQFADIDLDLLDAYRTAAAAPLRRDVAKLPETSQTPSVIHLKP